MVHDMAKELEDIKREAASLVTDQEVSKEMTFNAYNSFVNSGFALQYRIFRFLRRIFLGIPFKITIF